MAMKRKGGMGQSRAAGTDRGEGADGGMMGGKRGCANMPQDIISKDWHHVMEGIDMDEDDTIRGVDMQIGSDRSKLKGQLKPRKY